MCRTANGYDVNFEDSYRKNIESVINGGMIVDDMLSGCQKDGRGNICPITVILPEIAMMAITQEKACLSDSDEKPTEDDVINRFFYILKKKISDAKNSLIERFKYIASQSPASAKFMYENHTMSGYIESEGIVSALRHGTVAIGQLGLAETLYMLVGEYHTSPKGMELAKRIEQLFADKCNEYKKKYNMKA